jgi:acetylornithine aminotransferase
LNTYSRPPILFTHGKGSTIYAAKKGWQHPLRPSSSKETETPEYTAYLDFSAGIAVNALGHADPQITNIMTDQSSKITHLCNIYWNEWAGELARSLIEKTKESSGLGMSPGSDVGGKVFLANSGTEANEGALKLARKHGKDVAAAQAKESGGQIKDKSTLVCFTNAFHGRSIGALSVTPNPKYQEPFAPLVPNVRVGEFNKVAAINELIDESVCGVIVEPIQGEGGIGEADVKWLEAVGRRCREVGAVLIYDEIQVGGILFFRVR